MRMSRRIAGNGGGRLYLFRHGENGASTDQCTEVTGGWSKATTSATTLTLNAVSIKDSNLRVMYLQANLSGATTFKGAKTNNSIDMSGYNTLHVIARRADNNTPTRRIRVDNDTGSGDTQVAVTAKSFTPYTLDISSINSGRVVVETQGGANSMSCIEVQDIWLTRD